MSNRLTLTLIAGVALSAAFGRHITAQQAEQKTRSVTASTTESADRSGYIVASS